mmetsp:Transcript_32377/g.103185  ORF Transcript_32377/g.103185 Transcript_32377/m.103185 type:complete len:233 (-) Transcript_32377:263-961(-)
MKNWKDANGNVPMAGADVACEDALKAVWTGTASTSPYLPGLLSGIGWGTERKPPIVERDRRTGRVIGTRRGKGCEPTLLEIVAETTRAMNAMGLGWCLRIGPGQTAAHITVDAALDEYAQDPAGGPMYLGCSPPMLQLFKDRYREAVLEAESCAWDQAEDLANTVWNAVSDELTQRACSLTVAMRDVLARPGMWALSPSRAQAQAGSSDGAGTSRGARKYKRQVVSPNEAGE